MQKKRIERPRVAIYARVSTDEQAKYGLSLEQQPMLIEKHLQDTFGAAGYEILMSEKDEGKSGSYPPSVLDLDKPASARAKYRPGLRRLLEAMRAHEFDVLAFQDLSRLYRDHLQQQLLFKFACECGVRLFSCMENLDLDSASGEFSANVLAATAQFQRKQSNERIKHNLDLRKERGMWQGTPPFGWRFANESERMSGTPKTLVPIEEQLQTVRRIKELYLQGWREKRIADQLNAEGIKHVLKKRNSSGQQIEIMWDWQSISNILKCCAHAGLVKQPDESYKSGLHYEARAFDEDDFYRILETMSARRKTLRCVPKDREDNLLSKLVRCKECGQPLQFVKGTKDETDSYVCRGYRGRGDYHVYVSADTLLRAILHEMEQFGGLPDLMKSGEAKIRQLLAQELEDGPARIRDLAQQKARLDKQMTDALQHLRDGVLDTGLFAQQKEIILAERTPLEDELSKLQEKRDGVRFYESRLHKALAALRQFPTIWENLQPSERRELLRLSLEKAEIQSLDTHNILKLKLGPFPEKAIDLPRHTAAHGKSASGIKGLTTRELAALYYVGQGVRPVDACSRMGISAGTYSTLCKRAMLRVGETSVSKAAKKAATWINRVQHLLPLGPWQPKRRGSKRDVTIAEKIAQELHRDGLTVAQIATEIGLPESEVEIMIADASAKEARLGA